MLQKAFGLSASNSKFRPFRFSTHKTHKTFQTLSMFSQSSRFLEKHKNSIWHFLPESQVKTMESAAMKKSLQNDFPSCKNVSSAFRSVIYATMYDEKRDFKCGKANARQSQESALPFVKITKQPAAINNILRALWLNLRDAVFPKRW